jgi:hypothetical protein
LTSQTPWSHIGEVDAFTNSFVIATLSQGNQESTVNWVPTSLSLCSGSDVQHHAAIDNVFKPTAERSSPNRKPGLHLIQGGFPIFAEDEAMLPSTHIA